MGLGLIHDVRRSVDDGNQAQKIVLSLLHPLCSREKKTKVGRTVLPMMAVRMYLTWDICGTVLYERGLCSSVIWVSYHIMIQPGRSECLETAIDVDSRSGFLVEIGSFCKLIANNF